MNTSNPYRDLADVPASTTIDVAAAPATSEETFDEKRARLLASNQVRAQSKDQKKLEAEVARLELVEKLEREQGPEGQAFAIYDGSPFGEGLFAVKLGEAVLYTTFMESKITPVDRYDFVAPCIVHPTRSAYDAAQARRPGINIELSNRLAGLFGIQIKVNEGK